MSASLVGSEMCIRDRPANGRDTPEGGQLAFAEAPELLAKMLALSERSRPWCGTHREMTPSGLPRA
eukprot:10932434-Alexandrium_andersonii.AAC.1